LEKLASSLTTNYSDLLQRMEMLVLINVPQKVHHNLHKNTRIHANISIVGNPSSS